MNSRLRATMQNVQRNLQRGEMQNSWIKSGLCYDQPNKKYSIVKIMMDSDTWFTILYTSNHEMIQMRLVVWRLHILCTLHPRRPIGRHLQNIAMVPRKGVPNGRSLLQAPPDLGVCRRRERLAARRVEVYMSKMLTEMNSKHKST